MAALGALTVGAVGLAGMQKTILVANNHARNVATANAVASAWVERLRTDGVRWNSDTDLNDTTWLKTSTTSGTGWTWPTETATQGSFMADLAGTDIYTGSSTPQAFCTQIRLTTLYSTMIRAEVRVYWNHGNEPVTCDADKVNSVDVSTLSGTYGFVYVTTSIARNG